MKRDKILIELILREINDIEAFMIQTDCHNLDQFKQNIMLKKSVMMSIINISELISHLSEAFKYSNDHTDWQKFRSIRNIAAHKYGTINFTVVWNVIKMDIPDFKYQMIRANRNIHS